MNIDKKKLQPKSTVDCETKAQEIIATGERTNSKLKITVCIDENCTQNVLYDTAKQTFLSYY